MIDRLRILVVAFEWPRADGVHVGGVGRYAYRFTEELAAHADVTVATLAGPRRIDGVRFIEIGHPRGRLDRFYRLPWRLARQVDLDHYDLVHAHGDDWALQRQLPVVRTFHGSALNEARHSRLLRKLNHRLLSLLEHRSARRASVRVAVGADSMDEFGASRLMPPIVEVRRAEVDRTLHPSFVFVGSYGGRKRGWVAERVVAEVNSKFGAAASLHVVGPRADASNWTETFVTHHSGLNDGEVIDLIERSWCLLSPSTYEGFGIPMFEAASVGTPVVATANPGSVMLADEFGAGLVNVVPDEGMGRAVADVIRRRPEEVAAFGSTGQFISKRMVRAASAETFLDEICVPLVLERRREMEHRDTE